MGGRLGDGVGGIRLAGEQGGPGGGASGELIAPTITIEATAGAVDIDATGNINLTSSGGEIVVIADGKVGLQSIGNNIEIISDVGGVIVEVSDETTGGIVFNATGTPAGFSPGQIDIFAALDIGITSSGGNISVGAPGAGINLTAGAALSMTAETTGVLQSTDALTIRSTAGNLVLDTDTLDLLATINRDETHTVGRNFSISAAGSGGIQLTCTHATDGNILLESQNGDINIVAGTGDGLIDIDADLRITAGTIALFAAGGIDGTTTIADAAGGTVQDTEARTALNSLLQVCRDFGMID